MHRDYCEIHCRIRTCRKEGYGSDYRPVRPLSLTHLCHHELRRLYPRPSSCLTLHGLPRYAFDPCPSINVSGLLYLRITLHQPLLFNLYSQAYDQQTILRSTITPRQRCSGYRYILNKPQAHRTMCIDYASHHSHSHTLLHRHKPRLDPDQDTTGDTSFISSSTWFHSMTLPPTVRSSPQAHHLPSLVSLCSYPIIRVTRSADMQVIGRCSPDHAFPCLTSPNHCRHT